MPGGRPKGGRVVGHERKAYANRTDLNGPAPVRAASGQAYGQRKAQEDAQRAVPMGTPGVAPAASFTGRPESMPAPGALGDLFVDSTNPDEHVMNGAALGPGLGPEAFGQDPNAQMRQEDLTALAKWVPMLQETANRNGSSPYLRTWLRSVLGAGTGDLWDW